LKITKMFDVLITTAEKDYNKLRFVCNSIVRNIGNFHDVFIISPTSIPNNERYKNAHYLTDHEVIDFDFSKINKAYRIGWYRQQFIKLFQEVTVDNYLVVDSDVYINRKIDVNPENPSFYLGQDQLHKPYFEFNKKVFNLNRVYPHSFISEIMLFKRELIRIMLSLLKFSDMNEFFNTCVNEINSINDPSSFSEYELYGNYITAYWPTIYHYQQLKVFYKAKLKKWRQDEIEALIRDNTSSKYDILTMHSWV